MPPISLPSNSRHIKTTEIHEMVKGYPLTSLRMTFLHGTRSELKGFQIWVWNSLWAWGHYQYWLVWKRVCWVLIWKREAKVKTVSAIKISRTCAIFEEKCKVQGRRHSEVIHSSHERKHLFPRNGWGPVWCNKLTLAISRGCNRFQILGM